MSLVLYNPNPKGRRVGDCTVRAISKALGYDWERAYTELVLQGYIMSDMPSANSVWGALLKNKGFTRHSLPDLCPDCYTVRDFCNDYDTGIYVVALDQHVVCVIDGNYYDSFDSGDQVPLYYWKKE